MHPIIRVNSVKAGELTQYKNIYKVPRIIDRFSLISRMIWVFDRFSN